MAQQVALPLLRTSERNDFKRCPWLWLQTWDQGLTTVKTPTWAWFGTAIHAALEVRYKPGKKRGKVSKMIDAFEESMGDEVGRIWQEGGELSDEEVVDARELGHAMLRGYVDHYGPEKNIEVIHSEQSFQIDVPHPTKPGETLCVYAGTWDSLWLVDGELWLVDHKTRKSFPSNWSFYDINDQAGSYLWVAPEVLVHMGVLTKKEAKRIQGLIFNALRKHMPDKRPINPANGLACNRPLKQDYEEALSPVMDLPTRLPAIAVLEEMAASKGITVYGQPSKIQPAPLFHRETVERTLNERAKMGQRVQDEAVWMQAVRNGKMPAFKTPTEDCVRCQIFDYCQADEQDRDHREAMERGGVVLGGRKKVNG